MQVMKLTSRIMQLWRLVPDSLPVNGLNNNTTTSVKNGNFISEPQTDFIFAIVGEELGFVGCCIVMVCYY